MQTSETELMLRGYGLTTAEFFYRMPDYRHVLNTFVWQIYDLAPDYPKLFEFCGGTMDGLNVQALKVAISVERFGSEFSRSS